MRLRSLGEDTEQKGDADERGPAAYAVFESAFRVASLPRAPRAGHCPGGEVGWSAKYWWNRTTSSVSMILLRFRSPPRGRSVKGRLLAGGDGGHHPLSH